MCPISFVRTAIVLGAGIAGLTAAWELRRQGHTVLLLEKSERWGGCLHTVRQNGFLLEKGPNSFLEGHETIQKYLPLLGLEKEKITAKEAAKNRYIFSRGRLHRVPKTPADFFKTPLLSPWGKLRFLAEWMIPERGMDSEESIAHFVSRRFGKEALRLAEPMIHGIYAGSADRLSLPAIAPQLPELEKKYGSLLRGMKKARLFSQGNRLFSFRNGMETLADTFFHSLKENGLLHCQEIEISPTKDGWRVTWQREGISFEEEAKHLFLAVPATAAGSLLEKTDSLLAKELGAIDYAPLVIFHLIVARSLIPHPLDGFGFLRGAGESTPLLGCLWSSSIFEGRSDDPSKVLLTCFIGGDPNREVLHETDEALFLKIKKILWEIFRTSLDNTDFFATRLPRGLPQYTLGHLRRVAVIRERLRFQKNLHLIGNYLEGISVNDTMASALKGVMSCCAL